MDSFSQNLLHRFCVQQLRLPLNKSWFFISNLICFDFIFFDENFIDRAKISNRPNKLQQCVLRLIWNQFPLKIFWKDTCEWWWIIWMSLLFKNIFKKRSKIWREFSTKFVFLLADFVVKNMVRYKATEKVDGYFSLVCIQWHANNLKNIQCDI